MTTRPAPAGLKVCAGGWQTASRTQPSTSCGLTVAGEPANARFGLLQVTPKRGNHRLKVFATLFVAHIPGNKMLPDVSFQDLGHQAIHRTTYRRNLLQDCRALGVCIERAFKRFGLPLDAANPREKLLFP